MVVVVLGSSVVVKMVDIVELHNSHVILQFFCVSVSSSQNPFFFFLLHLFSVHMSVHVVVVAVVVVVVVVVGNVVVVDVVDVVFGLGGL